MLPRKEVTNQNQRHSILPGAGPVQLCVISVLNYYIWQTNFHLKENNKSLIMVISHGLNLCLWILHAPRSAPLVSHHFAPSAFPALHSWGSCVKTSLIVQPWTVPLSASVEPIQNQLCYACMHACMLSCVLTLCDSKDYSLQAPLSMGFSRQESWSGLPFPPPWGLPDSRIKAASSASPALVGWFFTMSLNTIPPCEALSMYILVLIATWKQSCILRSSQALKTNLGLNLSYYLIVLIVSKLNNLPMPRFTHL